MTDDVETPQKRFSFTRPAWATKKRVRLALYAGAGVVALFALGALLNPKDVPEYRTEEVQRTDVTSTVSASGKLEALETVTVGSQLSGQVLQVLVDFNSEVKKGQLLAVIDTETFSQRVRQSQASLSTALADLRVADADYARQKRLQEADLVSEKTLEDASAARARAAAQVEQARASVASDSADLARANIRSPIDGVVVNRTVDAGQTVAASLSAPELFVIAKDLSRLQIKILVDEADIGQVKEGQKVRFTVDAFPDDTFNGRVTQVRKQPEEANNVVTYVVMAEADNPGKKLLPGMTANADIIIEEHRDVLAAPSAALRWQPADVKDNPSAQRRNGGGDGQRVAGGSGGSGRGQRAMMNPDKLTEELKLDDKQKAEAQRLFAALPQKIAASGDDRRTATRKAMSDTFTELEKSLRPDQVEKLKTLRASMSGRRGAQQARTIYVLKKDKPEPVRVMVGANDGTNVEIGGDEIAEGDLVITGGGPEAKSSNASLPRGMGGGGGGNRSGGVMRFPV